MKRNLLASILLVFTVISVQAQRKSDLIAEIDQLKNELDSVNNELLETKKTERIAVAKAESFESQVNELQDANNTLMANMKSFAEVSNKNSNIVTSAMASLEAKENQLKSIKDAISSNDSTAIVVLTNVKQTMGENAKISVSNGGVVISSDLNSLFGSDTGDQLTAEGGSWTEKVAQILAANPKTSVTVEGLSMTGDIHIPAQQALSVARKLKEAGVEAERVSSLGRDGNLKEGIQVNIHPAYDQFYLMAREEMKN
ncbi:hypothetical protein D1013_12745 [Euzebyella marina]|uniref:OmpA-like domain-containing protein n=1 Tax=Euzebyella marina TaxID=1761453 RepID=A0A3G2L7E8_9FLAO|nr:hypothetical protein [Euzebyella marina]AYN68178.1 hypothetical protein D1013_12745 [Euzebyella marina]MBG48371.1 hypothetical protein [Pseudozobellia sp.]|tara:strand:+ start:1665 stop:2432 length:768 start_codon:yes stop_codon:yes gene_type:complete